MNFKIRSVRVSRSHWMQLVPDLPPTVVDALIQIEKRGEPIQSFCLSTGCQFNQWSLFPFLGHVSKSKAWRKITPVGVEKCEGLAVHFLRNG